MNPSGMNRVSTSDTLRPLTIHSPPLPVCGATSHLPLHWAPPGKARGVVEEGSAHTQVQTLQQTLPQTGPGGYSHVSNGSCSFCPATGTPTN